MSEIARPQPIHLAVAPDGAGRGQIRLAVGSAGGNSTGWSDPADDGRAGFDSFARLARTAERARFDFLLLADRLHPAEQPRLTAGLDVAALGRPDPFTVLAALASVTEHLGLAGTVDTMFDEPSELARRVAELDHLSAGRAGIRPVVLRAGDGDEGLESAAAGADVIVRPPSSPKAAQAFSADLARRLARHGRSRDELTLLSAASFVLGDTERQARELARDVRRRQVSGPAAIAFAEQLWNRDLCSYDPDGPLPRVDPWIDGRVIALGQAGLLLYPDPVATARQWRDVARRDNLSIRELVIEITARTTFVGTAAAVAAQIITAVQRDRVDGFLLAPHLVPGSLDEFADTVVPVLQERGVFRTEYQAGSLRDRLGLTTTTKERLSHEHAS